MQAGAVNIKLMADIMDLQAKMQQAERLVGNTVDKIKSSFGGMLATLGAGISIAGLTAFVKSAINSADALDEMSGRVGVSAKELSSLQLAFRQAGMSNEDMGSSLAKLSKQMADGNKMFDVMGVKVKNTDGTLRGTTSVLSDVADRFAGMQDGAGKTALAIELFGKSGAAMVPLLNGGSEGIREMTEMATKLGLVIEDSTAAQAGKFNDTLELLQLGVSGVGQGIAAQLLPSLNGLAGEFLTTMTSGDKLRNTADFLASGLKILYVVALGVVEVFSTVGKVIGGVAAFIAAQVGGMVESFRAIGQALSGDFAGAFSTMKSMVMNSVNVVKEAGLDIGSGWADTAKQMQGAWNATGNAAVDAAAKGIGANRNLIAEQKKREESEKAGASSAAAALKQANEYIQSLKNEAQEAGLTAEQVKMLSAARAAGKAPTAALRVEIMQAALALTIASKAEKDAADAVKALAKAQEEARKQSAQYYDVIAKGITAQEESNAKLREQFEEIGLTAKALTTLRLARQDETISQEEQTLAMQSMHEASAEELLLLQKKIDKLKEERGLTANVAVATENAKAIAEQTADWKKSVEQYDDIFRKGFAGMVNGGQGVWKSFTKSLFTTFKTSVADQIYKTFAQPFVVKFVASMLGVTGAAGAAAEVGTSAMSSAAGGFASSALGSISIAGSSIAAVGSSVMTGISAGFSGTSLAPAIAAFAEAGATGVAAGLSAGSAVGSVLGAIPVVGWFALAAMAAYSIFKGGETRNGGEYTTGADGKATLLQGPSGGEIAGGQARSMFDVTQSSIKGMLTALESKAVITGFTAGFEGSKKGKGFAFAGGLIDGKGFGEHLGRDGGQFSLGNKSPEEAMASYAVELKQAIVQALQAAADIPKTISDMLAGVDAQALDAAGVDALLTNISKVIATVNGFRTAVESLPFDYLKGKSFDAAAGLIAAAGGMDTLGANLTSFYDKFYTEQEKTANLTANTSAAFADLGLVMPALDAGARAAYRALVDQAGAQDLSVEANARAYASLLALNGAVDKLAPALDNVSPALTETASAINTVTESLQSAGASLQAQWDKLALSDADYRAKQISGMTALQVAQFDTNTALQASIDAFAATARAVADSAAALADARASLLAGVTAGASDAMSALTSAVNAQKEAQSAIATAAYTSQQTVMQSSIDATTASLGTLSDSVGKLKSLSASLKSTLDGLRISGSDAEYRAHAQAQISAALATARNGGGLPLEGQLSSALSTVSKPSEALFGSFEDYARDFYKTANDISALADLTNTQLSEGQVAEALMRDQLKSLQDTKSVLKDGFADQVKALDGILTTAQAQLDAANGINTAILSIPDALAQFAAAISGVEMVRATQGLPTTPGSAVAAAAVAAKPYDYASSAQGRADTIREYMRGLQENPNLSDTEKAVVLAARAQVVGVPESEIASAWGTSTQDTRAWFASAGVPQFEQGINYVPGDMDARIHEGEAVIPKAFNPFNPNAQRSDDTAAALRAMADRLDKIEANTRATAGHTAGTDHKLARVIPGNAVITQVAKA